VNGEFPGRRAAEGVAEKAAAAFHAVIRPHRSLSDRAFGFWIAGFIGFALVSSVSANILGLPPVGFFMGLDGLLIAAMFVVWQSAQDRREEILLDGETVVVRRYRRSDLVEQRYFAAGSLLIVRHEHPEFGCLGLRLDRNEAACQIAGDLSPHERAHFAEALREALATRGHRPIMRNNRTYRLQPWGRPARREPRD